MGKSAQVLNAPKRAWQVIIPATSVDRTRWKARGQIAPHPRPHLILMPAVAMTLPQRSISLLT